MQRIINFILDNRNTFLYVLLFVIGLVFTIQSHTYHHSKYFNSSKWLSGSLYDTKADITDYFSLKSENKKLIKENERLKFLLYNQQSDSNFTSPSNMEFEVQSAKVIKNSFALARNYLTINAGEKSGIKQDMGVITSQGILGVVENTSNNFATVQSILNTKSSINAKIKHTDYFGSLKWNARDYRVVQLIDIPRSVPVMIGDTIVTGGMSSIFPENIPIGTIKTYNLNQSQSSYDIEVDLINDMANIRAVYIIKNKNREEILELEKLTIDAQ
ncbi:Rod shape-determining protein MreC [Croceitalea dokdonensis DOKDO 023]|uniref:Cell shape-determining protein MreC n=1 Tax=Croceitalea dokdonensis DOKDO 023 TaxID=1300341 RepID=A0A0P7AGR0_9FLAO|nr:rod shape-determining protein MreC [Croceitalea dokdonensis]KPM32645.1 Rod shape-determining protein MreC [Croceitalea dokdonensis DOKDO 023]